MNTILKENRVIDNFCELNINKPPTIFCFMDNYGNWLIQISKGEIKFNREKFPNFTPQDFANSFIEILEKNYAINLEKKPISDPEVVK